MLDELTATNLGLIAQATLEPGPGLTVITGETGTGKTLMLGALRLVRGESASKGTIGPHGDSADVAARFVDSAGTETVVRRVVTAKRSRAYIDGVPATATELASVIASRVSIVGQHDQHTLASSEGIRVMIDSMFNADERTQADAYLSAYEDLAAVEAEMTALGSDRRGLERELEMARFQVSEIADAGFSDGEEEELRGRLERLRHAEEIAADLAIATEAIAGEVIDTSLRNALGALGRVARRDPSAVDLEERLAQIASDVDEVSSDMLRYADGVGGDPAELAADEQRLAELSALKRKYGDTVSDINAFAKQAMERIEIIEEMLEAAESLGDRHSTAIAALDEAGATIRTARRSHAAAASVAAVDHLRTLGFDSPTVHIQVEPKDPTATGADKLVVLFASDDSLTPAPISSVASGGELSRLVLALALACGTIDAEVVAFDEIDAGIGGSTALAMGEKLAALARTRQVICVTHLPQVAAFGTRHFTVRREGTTAIVEPVEGRSRVEEVSRMLSGLEVSDNARLHAQELLERATVVAGDSG